MQATTQEPTLVWESQDRVLSIDAVKIFSAFLDMLLLAIPGILTFVGYVGWTAQSYSLYVPVTAALSAATVLAFYMADLYRLKALTKPISFVPHIGLALLAVLCIFIGVLFALKESASLSRVWVFTWFLAGSGMVVIGRILLSWYLRGATRAGELAHNIVIVGGGERGQQLIRHLQTLNDPLSKIVGVFDDRLKRISPEVCGVPLLGNLEDLVKYARTHRCDEILVALPWDAPQRVTSVVNGLRVLPVHVSLSPDLAGLNMLPTRFRECAGVPVLAMSRKPFTGAQALVKKVEDTVVGGLLTLCALPVMAIIAVMIKLDSPGPVLFRQPRYGFNNKLINVYKFRTMYTDKTDMAGSQLTQKDDPRITRLGRFLRRSSLDELPQFFNVLKGEMSIVGPRPHALQAKAGPRLYEDVVIEYAARHRVKPGITGWAQVNGWRGETNTDEQIMERVKHDLFYIDNWSLTMDMIIILKTIGTVLRADKAM